MKLEVYTGETSNSIREAFEDVIEHHDGGILPLPTPEGSEDALLIPTIPFGGDFGFETIRQETLVRLQHCGRLYVFDLTAWDWLKVALRRPLPSAVCCRTCGEDILLEIEPRHGRDYFRWRAKVRIALMRRAVQRFVSRVAASAVIFGLVAPVAGGLAGLCAFPELFPASPIAGAAAGALIVFLVVFLLWLRHRGQRRREATLAALSGQPEWNGSMPSSLAAAARSRRLPKRRTIRLGDP